MVRVRWLSAIRPAISALVLVLATTVVTQAASAACTFSAFQWTDGFEAEGHDEVYAEPGLAQPGNDIWPDARNSDVSAYPGASAIPAAWGDEHLLLKIGNVAGGALARTEFDEKLVVMTSHVEFMVLESDMDDDTWITIAVVKGAGGPGESWPVAWSAHVRQYASLSLEVKVGIPPQIYVTPITLGGVHALDVTYDTNGSFAVSLDGNPLGSGPVVDGYARDIWWMIVGASGSSTGRNISVAIDNFNHTGFVCHEN